MNVLSLNINIRGLVATHKYSSLRGLIRMRNPSVILIEETMLPREKTWEDLLSICP